MGVGTVLITYFVVIIGVFACGAFLLKFTKNINSSTKTKVKFISIPAGYLFVFLLFFLPFGFWSIVVGLLGLFVSKFNMEIGNTQHGLNQIFLLVIAILANALLIAFK
ncbi:MAG: hypothetical protein PHD36_03805 [Desulfotomaculaceae bacterium]|nr:hypothetical protein [Desulfotomaculaceae bacterium]